MYRSGRRLVARSFPRIKSQVFLAAAAATATFCSSRTIGATNYSLVGTFTGGTWGNSYIWSPTGTPGSSDSIIESTIAGSVTLDAGGDSILDLSFSPTASDILQFLSPSTSATTLTVGDAITKSGMAGGLTLGTSNNPVTLAGTGTGAGAFVTLNFTGSGTPQAGNNSITIGSTNSLDNVNFAFGGNLRASSAYNTGNSTSTTLTIQGNVSITPSATSGTVADFRMLQSGSSTTSSANFTVVGNLTGTLGTGSTGNQIEIDDSNSGSLSATNTFNLEGTATGLTVANSSSYLEFGTGLNNSGSQWKYGTLLLSNSDALATKGTPIPVWLGSTATTISSTSASYVGLSLVSAGSYSFNNPINIQGIAQTGGGTLTQTYTIGGQNALGTTATFSGPITIGSGSLQPNLQVSSSYSGATLAFTGNITQATATYNQAVTVAGAGIVLLTGSNSYAGGTTINSGATLLVSNTTGSGTGAGSVTVAGVLAGTGTISGAVSTTATTGTIQPGTSSTIGTLYTGALTLLDNSKFSVNINSGSVVGTTGASSDLISTGTVTLGTSAFALLSVTDLGSTVLPAGDVFTIIQSADPITTAFQNLPEGKQVTYGVNTFDISYLGDDVTLTTVTPEPAGVALLAIGAMGMLARRKRNPSDAR